MTAPITNNRQPEPAIHIPEVSDAWTKAIAAAGQGSSFPPLDRGSQAVPAPPRPPVTDPLGPEPPVFPPSTDPLGPDSRVPQSGSQAAPASLPRAEVPGDGSIPGVPAVAGGGMDKPPVSDPLGPEPPVFPPSTDPLGRGSQVPFLPGLPSVPAQDGPT